MQISQLETYELSMGNHKLRGYVTPLRQNPLIHFVHGTGFCSLAYWPFLQHFHGEYDLWLHDVQGHGSSDVALPFVGWNGSAASALRVIDAHQDRFNQGPVIGLGHSFGAVVTLLMAAMRPQVFDAVVLMDPVLFPRRQLRMMALLARFGLLGWNAIARRTLRRKAQWSDRDAAFEYLHERGIFRGWAEEALGAYIDHALAQAPDGSLSLKCSPKMEAALFSTYPAKLWQGLAAINVPTVILRGEQGMRMLADTAPQATAINPNIRLVGVDGGHCFMQERPQQSANKVIEVLDGLLPQV